MAAEGNGDLPVPDLRTIEELCQPSLNGQGGPIAPIAIQETNFGLKNDMIQQVQNSCQFHGLPVVLIPLVIVQPPLATLRTYMLWEPIKFMKMNKASYSGSRTIPGNIITNPKEELKGITTRSGNAYQGPMMPTSSSIVERETEATKDTVHPTNNGSTKDVQLPVVQTESPILNFKPIVAPIIELVVAPVSAPKPTQIHSISYLLRFHDRKRREKANDQRERFFQIFKE
nr:reverse transcriptase domain-containing protein [Tanacetum cinerariifolium]